MDTLKEGDSVNPEEILDLLSLGQPSEKLDRNKILFPSIKTLDDTEYRVKHGDSEFTYRIEGWNDNSHCLSCETGPFEKSIRWNQENKITVIHCTTNPITLTEEADITKIYPHLNKIVGAVLYSERNEILLDIHFDDMSFSEAGVYLFGNNGDSTFDNAYYWSRGEASPLFNNGWMIWGNLYFNEKLKSLFWIPYNNEEIFDYELSYYTEEYQMSDKGKINMMKKKFILNDLSKIESKLSNLKILYDEIIEY